MSEDAFHPDLTAAASAPAQVHHVRAADLDAGTAQTSGMRRFAAISGRKVGSDKLWMGETHVGPAIHEWSRHGTCSGVSPAVYFSHAVTLTEQAAKVLNPVFERAAGRRLSRGEVRKRLKAEFGNEAGKRVNLICKQADRAGIIAYEVHLSLPPVADLGPAESPLSLRDLLVKGPLLNTKCRAGHVP